MTAYSMPSTRPIAEPRLYSERLPGYAGVRAELVLLHGWGMDSEIWRGLVSRLRACAHVTLVDLPACGRSAVGSWQRRDILDAILSIAPPSAVYLGWSLGGNIALALADEAPERVSGVITLACNPCFVADDDWPEAMEPREFEQFMALVGRRGAASLSRFDALQCGGAEERDALRWCRRWRARQPYPEAAMLRESLGLLAELDLRDTLGRLEQPVRHVLAESDRLVPPGVSSSIRERAPQQAVRLLPGRNHLLPLFAMEEILEELSGILVQLGLAPAASDNRRDKRDVARSFSRAAASYDSAADLQRRVGRSLLQYLPGDENCRNVLDLGSGTGCFRAGLQSACPTADYVGLDLAEGMARFARGQDERATGSWLVGDAEDLPLAASSMDLVFSSLAIQWSEQPALLFSEVERVLRPGGRFLFSTLGPRTLSELRGAWEAADGVEHVNRFLPRDQLESGLGTAGLHLESLQSEDIVLEYDSALDLLRELKAIGAHNVNAGRPRGLTPRARLQAMVGAYEALRRNDKLPATYEVLYAVVSKGHD